jgi:hypothetical protein
MSLLVSWTTDSVGLEADSCHRVLVPRSDPHTLDVLSSTRTFKRDAKMLTKGKDSVDPVTSYVITSVFTPSQHRSQ